MTESADPKLTIDQAAPLVASAVEQSLDDAGSVVEDIDALLKDVESLEPAVATAAVASVQNLADQARAIDQTARSATSVAAPMTSPVSQQASSNANTTALNQADQALANDLDALLQGDFESIDAVLDGVFDEQAVLVQAAEHVKAKTPRQMEIESAASRDTDQVHQEQPTVRDAQPIAVSEPMSASIAAPMELPREETVVLASAAEIATSPASATLAPVPIAATVAVPDTIAPNPNVPVAHAAPAPVQAEPSPVIKAVEADAAVVAMPQPSAPPAPPRRKIQIRINLSAITAPLKQIAYQALTLINLPFKLVPAKFKAAVDIMALSLVLWVPLAFILPPKIAAWNAARAAAAHTTGAVHAESSNAGHESGDEAPAENHGGGSGGHEAPKGHGGGH